MSEVIDTAAWTGRDWDFKWQVSRGCIVLYRLHRNRIEGEMAPCWGVQIGRDWMQDCRGIRVFCGYKSWAPVMISEEAIFEYFAARRPV